VEWHGPHLAMGCDNLLAHAFARRLARELECPYYPPLFAGTERQRNDENFRDLFQHEQHSLGCGEGWRFLTLGKLVSVVNSKRVDVAVEGARRCWPHG